MFFLLILSENSLCDNAPFENMQWILCIFHIPTSSSHPFVVSFNLIKCASVLIKKLTLIVWITGSGSVAECLMQYTRYLFVAVFAFNLLEQSLSKYTETVQEKRVEKIDCWKKKSRKRKGLKKKGKQNQKRMKTFYHWHERHLRHWVSWLDTVWLIENGNKKKLIHRNEKLRLNSLSFKQT